MINRNIGILSLTIMQVNVYNMDQSQFYLFLLA